MKTLRTALILLALFVLSLTMARAQTDEVSDATGLPIPIGQPVIYGQVAIEGLPANERRPTIFVTLLISGTQIDRRPTDSRGYFYFLQRPRHGHMLVFEINGGEVGRAYLTVGDGTRLRQDVAIQWRTLQGVTPSGGTGVVSSKVYVRSQDAEKVFANAMDLIRDKKGSEAVAVLEDIVKKDPNDFVAWMMLGTLYVDEKKFREAETALLKSTELKPDFTLARVNLGKMYIGQNDFDKAIAALTKAVELDASSADANHYLGEAYLRIKKGSLAVGYLNKAIELEPVKKAELHLRLAALYNGAGLKDRAAAEYAAFLAKVKDHPDTKKFEQYVKDNAPAKP